MKINDYLLGTLAGSLLLAAGNANALLISPTGNSLGSPSQPTYQAEILQTDVGQSFSQNWLVPAGTVGDYALPVDVTATVTFSISGFTTNANDMDSLTLGIDISNTTDLSAYPGTNMAIMSFGFGVDPNATAVMDSAGSTFDDISAGNGPQQTYPGGFSYIDVCIYADGCTGGNVNLGLQAGDSDSLLITLLGDFDQNGTASGSAMLLDFPMKFQGTWGSFETPGSSVPPSVPEPGTLALMAIALFAFRFHIQRAKE